MAKVTKRENFEATKAALNAVGNFEFDEFLDAQVALLDKRAGAERKATKTQVENEALKDAIVEVLDGVEDATATDVAKALDVSVQKVAQLLRQLVAETRVTRVEGKGKNKTTFVVA